MKNFKYPDWRLENLYRVVNKDSEKIPFKPNSIQKLINKNKSKRKMILKSRQVGITTNEVLKCLDFTLFNRNVTACILAHEDDAISKIFNIPRNAYSWLPDGLKPDISKGGGSKYEMYFPSINSRIYCDLESRGDTINWLHVSEAAFMDESRLKATLQAVPINGIVTLETTANGLENFFYDDWMDEASVYEKLFFPWYFHHEYKIKTDKLKLTIEEQEFVKKAKTLYGYDISLDQIAYRRFKIGEIKNDFVQEYPEDDATCFIHSGRTVVDQFIFQNLKKKIRPPIDNIGDIKIYAHRDSKKDYIVSADPAQGVGRDFSVSHVICVQDAEEVAFFRGQLPPSAFAKKLKEICDIFTTGFRTPILAVEMNNHGHAVLLKLIETYHYGNLYFRKDKEDEPGWNTNLLTRPIMIDQLIETVGDELVKFHSEQTHKEIAMLVEKNGKIQAPSGKTDDCVMSAAIGVQVFLEQVAAVNHYQNVSRDIVV